jgi:signal transduction histidine kinase
VSHQQSLARALRGDPRRFLGSRRPWLCLAYLITTVQIGLILALGTVILAGTGIALLVVLVGLPILTLLVLTGLPVGALERRRLWLVSQTTTVTPHITVPRPGLAPWLRTRLGEAATWRAFGYVLALSTVLPVLDLAALTATAFAAGPLLIMPWRIHHLDSPPDVHGWVIENTGQALLAGLVGVAIVAISAYPLSALAGLQAAFARWMLAPRKGTLARQVADLARSRERLVEAFESERRRIERDLHDGAQQHLVMLTMTLGLAGLELSGPDEGSEGPDDTGSAGGAPALVAEAQRQARLALSGLRDLIRGIHPQVLTDLGIEAAVLELAERCTVPTTVDMVLPQRLPASVESVAYFVVSEALTNVVRHASATMVQITGRVVRGRLIVNVTDNGSGGADPARGSGLQGLADRTAVLEGTLTVHSPMGGPTTLRVKLPCR